MNDAVLAELPALVEREDVLEGDHAGLHAQHLGEVGDPAGPVPQPAEVDDQVDPRCDLLPDGTRGQVEAGHQHHGLEPGDGVTRGVGVQGRHRAVVARVHRLQHVERFAAADLADDDPVGPHAQGVAEQVADGDLTPVLDVGRPTLEADDVLLHQLQLGRVLDGDDALVRGDRPGEQVQQGGLAGAGATAHQDVELAHDAQGDELGQLGGERLEADEVIHGQGHLGELPDRERRPVERQGREDGVDPGTIGQAGVDHGGGLVDPAADLAHDALDHPAQVVVEQEPGLRGVELALALHVDRPGAGDHDLADGGVGEERLQGAVPEDVLGDVVDQALALGGGERGAVGLEHAGQLLDDEAVQLLLGHLGPEQAATQAAEQRLLGPLLDGGERVGGRRRLAVAGRCRLPGGSGLRSLDGRRDDFGRDDAGLLQALVQLHFASFREKRRPRSGAAAAAGGASTKWPARLAMALPAGDFGSDCTTGVPWLTAIWIDRDVGIDASTATPMVASMSAADSPTLSSERFSTRCRRALVMPRRSMASMALRRPRTLGTSVTQTRTRSSARSAAASAYSSRPAAVSRTT